MRLPRENRRAWLVAGALVIVAAVVAGIAISQRSKPTGRTYNPHVGGFTASTSTTPVTRAAKFIWPLYGFNDQRTRVFDNGDSKLNGPFRVGWSLGGNAPVEFPPVLDGNALYFMDDNATVNKVNATTGKRYKRVQIGKLSAATPALDVKDGLMFAPVLSTTSSVINSVNGRFVALSMKTLAVKWSMPVPSGSESSPLVWGHNVYFGDKGGTMYDVNALTGKVIWSIPTGGAVKGGASLDNGILYFGNYAGQLYAVHAATGTRVWEVNLGGAIYGSPTLAFGLVYIANKDSGRMYALAQKTGQQVWAVGTGSYVYSSAAAETVPGLGPTVFFGSYTGTAYAVDARTGKVDWTANVGDSVSGAASIVNDVVYFSGVYHSISRGFNVTSGKQVFYFHDGAYTTTIASPRAVYLSGHYTLYELLPKR